MLVGLTSLPESGKDTAFQILDEHIKRVNSHGVDGHPALVRRLAFGDHMKVCQMTSLGFTGTRDELIALADKAKFTGHIVTEIGETPDENSKLLAAKHISGRDGQRLFAAESIRDGISEAAWADNCLPNGLVDLFADDRDILWVITDVRTAVEASRTKQSAKAELWRIHRPITFEKYASVAHRVDSPFLQYEATGKYVDFIINNDGDLAHFETLVLERLNQLIVKHFG